MVSREPERILRMALAARRSRALLLRSETLKRAFDLTITSAIAPVIFPLALGVAAGMWMIQGRPILFRQLRPGRRGALFRMYKFRTMTDARDGNGNPLEDAERLTKVGAWLRKTSLDELPEFFNVLLGDMALVGPRPLLLQYLPRYSSEQARRHEVKPGITGWTQIHGRNALGWDERLALDVWYVDHYNLLLDLQILIRTIPTVLGRHGVTAEGHATVPEFLGSGAGAGMVAPKETA